LESRGFLPVTSEHLHWEVVEPTLVLLSDSRFSEIDALYRKALTRVLTGDVSGAITPAISTVEEVLRIIAQRGRALPPLAERRERRE
jgi:hypothetical protein